MANTLTANGSDVEVAPDGRSPLARRRHAADVLRLIGNAVLLVGAVAAVTLAPDELLGPGADVVDGVGPDTSVGSLLVALVQVAAVGATLAVVAGLLRRRRFRLLATVAGGAVVAGLVMVAVDRVVGLSDPDRLSANLAEGSWLAGSTFPTPAEFAAAVAVAVMVASWLSRPWRRAMWTGLALAALARLVSGTILPFELLLAFASGSVVGSALLVAFGAPDRRIGAAGVAAALRASGLPVTSVTVGTATGKGSQPFEAVADGRRLFVKVLGQDERDADLLYRAYRLVRLRGVDDVRPAATLRQAVEHQALVALMAEHAGVRVPHVERVVDSDEGSTMLAMALVEGRQLDEMAPESFTDELLDRLWSEVDHLHAAGIAHRSMHNANVMVDGDLRPWIVDFSFSELAATDRQKAMDVAELLASLAAIVGPERAVASAVRVMGAGRVRPALPLLQPLALSGSTRKVAGKGLLVRTRAAAADASGGPPEDLAKIQRVRPRTLLMIAVAAGAFYLLLPRIAEVGSGWRAFQSADVSWLVVVVLMSALTYVGAGIGMLGAVPQRIAVLPAIVVQWASSFVNRVTPASIGGMALNVRFLQKSGVPAPTAVAGVAVNSLAGAIVHVVLIVVFFAWSGRAVTKAFALPTGSTLLVGVVVVVALLGVAAGVAFLTRWGRRKLADRLVSGLRSAVANLSAVAKSPVKLALLFGGSLIVTLAYVASFGAAVAAFGGGLSVAEIGAIYLGGTAVAAAAPTPGNLGALEAALVAGLTGFGIASGVAVSTVLTYRLATYWLPIFPGWLSWHLVQRWNYV